MAAKQKLPKYQEWQQSVKDEVFHAGTPKNSDNAAIDATTGSGNASVDDHGQYTDELSDLTDDVDQTARKHTIVGQSSWYRKIQPLMKNPRIRRFTIMNTVLVILNLTLVLVLIVSIIYAIVLHGQVVQRADRHKPCIYEWTEWSPCSATCRKKGSNDYPVRWRMVNKEKIVQARGLFAEVSPCPANLTKKVDFAPCNTHFCPIKLSSVNFTKNCFLYDVSNETGPKYKIRNLEIDDQLVEVDATLTEECDQ